MSIQFIPSQKVFFSSFLYFEVRTVRNFLEISCKKWKDSPLYACFVLSLFCFSSWLLLVKLSCCPTCVVWKPSHCNPQKSRERKMWQRKKNCTYCELFVCLFLKKSLKIGGERHFLREEKIHSFNPKDKTVMPWI